MIATDLSGAQLEQAPELANVEYRVAPAEASGLPDASVDVVAVAQALHWFDLGRFFSEATRVLRANGVLAAWSYNIFRTSDPTIDALIDHFAMEIVGPYWPIERRIVDRSYRDLALPLPQIVPPSFAMEAEWLLSRVLGYMRTWSATTRYIAERGTDPVTELAPELGRLWGDPELPRRVEWPLIVLAGRRAPRQFVVAQPESKL